MSCVRFCHVCVCISTFKRMSLEAIAVGVYNAHIKIAQWHNCNFVYASVFLFCFFFLLIMIIIIKLVVRLFCYWYPHPPLFYLERVFINRLYLFQNSTKSSLNIYYNIHVHISVTVRCAYAVIVAFLTLMLWSLLFFFFAPFFKASSKMM